MDAVAGGLGEALPLVGMVDELAEGRDDGLDVAGLGEEAATGEADHLGEDAGPRDDDGDTHGEGLKGGHAPAFGESTGLHEDTEAVKHRELAGMVDGTAIVDVTARVGVEVALDVAPPSALIGSELAGEGEGGAARAAAADLGERAAEDVGALVGREPREAADAERLVGGRLGGGRIVGEVDAGADDAEAVGGDVEEFGHLVGVGCVGCDEEVDGAGVSAHEIDGAGGVRLGQAVDERLLALEEADDGDAEPAFGLGGDGGEERVGEVEDVGPGLGLEEGDEGVEFLGLSAVSALKDRDGHFAEVLGAGADGKA